MTFDISSLSLSLPHLNPLGPTLHHLAQIEPLEQSNLQVGWMGRDISQITSTTRAPAYPTEMYCLQTADLRLAQIKTGRPT